LHEIPTLCKNQGFCNWVCNFFFLNCNEHLQFMILIQYECYWTSCNNCTTHPKLYTILCITKYMCNSSATRYNYFAILGIHINFLHKCPWMNGMKIWLFIQLLIDEIDHILYNICIIILSLVIHVRLSCKCFGWM